MFFLLYTANGKFSLLGRSSSRCKSRWPAQRNNIQFSDAGIKIYYPVFWKLAISSASAIIIRRNHGRNIAVSLKTFTENQPPAQRNKFKRARIIENPVVVFSLILSDLVQPCGISIGIAKIPGKLIEELIFARPIKVIPLFATQNNSKSFVSRQELMKCILVFVSLGG